MTSRKTDTEPTREPSKETTGKTVGIAQAAEELGLSTHTLRYYEQEGLVGAVGRDAAGSRRYGAADLRWIAFLTRLRATGMPVARMQRFSELRAKGASTLPQRRQMLAEHRERLLERIALEQEHLATLEDKITRYDTLIQEEDKKRQTGLAGHPREGTDSRARYLNGPSYEHGLAVLRRVDGEAGEAIVNSLSGTSPRLVHDVVAHGFGEVYDRPGLSDRERQLVTLGALTALGGCEAQLRVHVRASLNVGLSPEQVVTVMEHSAVYCGFPRALNAIGVVKEVLDQQHGAAPDQSQADGHRCERQELTRPAGTI